jgi:putative mycofactocin binding protein MftB
VFDTARGWRCSPSVALRPEPFGALVYHFGTRRLSFLKSPMLLSVVGSLAERPTAREACLAAGVREEEIRSYRSALATLAASQMICERSTS